MEMNVERNVLTVSAQRSGNDGDQVGPATRRVAERTSVGSGGGSHGADERRP